MKYQIIESELGPVRTIVREDEFGVISSFAEDEANSDYQQYLLDTDGGLPIPE